MKKILKIVKNYIKKHQCNEHLINLGVVTRTWYDTSCVTKKSK